MFALLKQKNAHVGQMATLGVAVTFLGRALLKHGFFSQLVDNATNWEKYTTDWVQCQLFCRRTTDWEMSGFGCWNSEFENK